MSGLRAFYFFTVQFPRVVHVQRRYDRRGAARTLSLDLIELGVYNVVRGWIIRANNLLLSCTAPVVSLLVAWLCIRALLYSTCIPLQLVSMQLSIN